MVEWKKYYNDYSVNQELIWLNNCGTTPIGNRILQEVTSYLHGYAKKGVFTELGTFSEVRRGIISILSSLLNCDKDELAIIHNTSEGMNFISLGLGLDTGDEILLLENEYPSNVYPWNHWKERGVLLNFLELKDSPEEFLEYFRNRIKPNTKLITISAVHWCTGMPLPIKEIGRICREKNICFVLDGAQGVGHVPIDVKTMHIDFMAFPVGNGYSTSRNRYFIR